MAVQIDFNLCTGCGKCIGTCSAEAIIIDESLKKAIVDTNKCTECGLCIDVCKKNAISMNGSNIKNDRTFAGNGDNSFMRGAGYGSGMKTQRMGRGQSRSMGQGRGMGSGRGAGQGRGMGQGEFSNRQRPDVIGQCLCPNCGLIIPHTAGAPCSNIKCSGCGVSMIRK